MKTITYKTAKVIRTIAASLIILVLLSGVSKGASSGKEATQINTTELTVQLKSWISDNTTWSESGDIQVETTLASDFTLPGETDNKELSTEIEAWISDNSLWSNETVNVQEDLSSRMKSWIGNSNYWGPESENNDHELAVQIKSWITESAFWNGTEELSHTGNELANN